MSRVVLVTERSVVYVRWRLDSRTSLIVQLDTCMDGENRGDNPRGYYATALPL